MSFHFRCQRCRGRNVMPRHWHDYARPKRCRHCGHTRFYLDRERTYRTCCSCDGAYHWGPHRPGSPLCWHNRHWQANRAARDGEDDAIVAALRSQADAMTGLAAQAMLDGVEDAPVSRIQQALCAGGMLWMPARITGEGDDQALEVWIAPPPGGLPIFASWAIPAGDATALIDATDLEQRMQYPGMPVLARGFGIRPAVVAGRECLRFGITSYGGPMPAGDHAAAVAAVRGTPKEAA
ncbi:MAG: hypothetical protein QM702_00125 [Rubrivivax sp.]